MSEQSLNDREWLNELLAERAVFGLSLEDEQELQELFHMNPDVNTDDLDHLAALLDETSYAANLPPLPPKVVARVRLQAPHPAATVPNAIGRSWIAKREVLAWLTAAGCLLMAVYAMSTRNPVAPNLPPTGDSSLIVKREPDAGPTDSPVVSTLAQQREELLALSEGVLHVRLSASADATDPTISGDIVWSHTQQRGFLRLEGLPSNDPTKSQYQIWIGETSPMRSETINGGVFNVDQERREIIVPIRVEQFVKQPNIFVISIEPPGGSPDLTVSSYPAVAKVGDTP